MKHSVNEAEFQKKVVEMFEGVRAHVQVHSERFERGVPDLSVAYGRDYWLELKYGEFTIDREHDEFGFRESKRDQLEWLRRREGNGRARCGILGYMRIKPQLLTHYVFFMTGQEYLSYIWKASLSVSAVILSGSVVNADDIMTGQDLADFIDRADPGRLRKR